MAPQRDPREEPPRLDPNPNAGKWLGEGEGDDPQRAEAAERAGKALEADEAGGLTAAERDQRREGDGQPVDRETSDTREPYPG